MDNVCGMASIQHRYVMIIFLWYKFDVDDDNDVDDDV